jgi:hypothetical protein
MFPGKRRNVGHAVGGIIRSRIYESDEVCGEQVRSINTDSYKTHTHTTVKKQCYTQVDQRHAYREEQN